MQQKIVLIGGPGTGKTTVLNALKEKGYTCFEEISREVTIAAQKEGIAHLFQEDPLLFSQKLLEGRVNQYKKADNSDVDIVFFDRGIPDVFAYMDYFKQSYPSSFVDICKELLYTKLFIFSPWEAIYTNDNERYETFDQTVALDQQLRKAYTNLGYKIIDVPFGSANDRVNFILNSL